MEICTYIRRNFEADIIGHDFCLKGHCDKVIATDTTLCEIGGLRAILGCEDVHDLDTLLAFFTSHFFDLFDGADDELFGIFRFLNEVVVARKNELINHEEN